MITGWENEELLTLSMEENKSWGNTQQMGLQHGMLLSCSFFPKKEVLKELRLKNGGPPTNETAANMCKEL